MQGRLRILGQRRAELANQDQEPQETRVVRRIVKELAQEAQNIRRMQESKNYNSKDELRLRLDNLLARMGEFEECNLRTLCKYPSLLSEFKEIYGLMKEICVMTITSILDRGENLELLYEKTSILRQSAYKFEKISPSDATTSPKNPDEED